MARRLRDPGIEDTVSNRVHMTRNTIDRVAALSTTYRWSKRETYEYLLRFALVAHEKEK